jgi:hypothetical protein
VEKRICLSRDMQLANVAWWAVMMIEAGEGDLVQRNGDDQCNTPCYRNPNQVS